MRRAQFNIGVYYHEGLGVAVDDGSESDDAEAVKWFKRAAETGHAEAQIFCRQL